VAYMLWIRYEKISFPRCISAAAKMTLGPAISINHGLRFKC
jgi:hypothetical protein